MGPPGFFGLVVEAEHAAADGARDFRAVQAGRRSPAGHGKPPRCIARWIVPVVPDSALSPPLPAREPRDTQPLPACEHQSSGIGRVLRRAAPGLVAGGAARNGSHPVIGYSYLHAALDDYSRLACYNHHRGHTALKGLPPASRVANLRTQHLILQRHLVGHRDRPLVH